MTKKKLLYTSLTALTLASAIGYHPAFAEDEANPDLEITLQSDTQDGSEDIVLDDDINIDDATNQKEELGDTTDKEEEKEEKVQKTFTASYTYLAIYYDTTNDKELSKDGYRVDIVKDEENPQVELSKTYYDLDGQEIDEADIIDYTQPIEIEGYEYVNKAGDGNGAATGGTISVTHYYKEVEKSKLSTEVFGAKVNKDILPIKVSLTDKHWKGAIWPKSTIENLPSSDIVLNLLVIDKDGKEMSVGRKRQSELSTLLGYISTDNYPDGEYTLVVSGYTGYRSNFQRYEGRLSFEIKNGNLVKELDSPVNKNIIAGVSQFPLEIEDVIKENIELINITQQVNDYFDGSYITIGGLLSWKPQKVNYRYEIYNSEQKLMDADTGESTNSLEFRNFKGYSVGVGKYPDGIYTIKMTGQADERDNNQEFLGYSAFEIRKGRYVGIIPVLVTPKKEDDGKKEPEIPELDQIPEKNLPKDNPDVDIIPEEDEQDDKKSNDGQTPSPSSPEKSTTKSSSSTKQTAKPSSSTTNKSNSTNINSQSGSNQNNSKSVPELGEGNDKDGGDGAKPGEQTEEQPKKETILKKITKSLPSTGEVTSILGVLGLALIGVAIYFFKKRDK